MECSPIDRGANEAPAGSDIRVLAFDLIGAEEFEPILTTQKFARPPFHLSGCGPTDRSSGRNSANAAGRSTAQRILIGERL